MRACARNCTPRLVFVYVHACVRARRCTRVCVARTGGESRRRGPYEQAGEREAGAADSLCPRKLCNGPRLHVFPTPLPPSLPAAAAAAAAASLFHPPFSTRPPAPVASASSLDHGEIASRSFARRFSLGPSSCSPLCRIRALSRLHHALPPSLCHSIAAESSQPDAGTARGRNDPRARQGRAEGVIRSSPYVHRAAPGIRIIKLRDSLPLPTTPCVSDTAI